MASTPDDLKSKVKSPGWQLEAGGETKHGTLEDVLRLAHARKEAGHKPGIIRQLETSLELEMLQIEQLWRYLGLPV